MVIIKNPLSGSSKEELDKEIFNEKSNETSMLFLISVATKS